MYTKEEANVLDRMGFYLYWLRLRAATGLTRQQAYEATESVHQRVHRTGNKKHSDFSSFERNTYLLAKKTDR